MNKTHEKTCQVGKIITVKSLSFIWQKKKWIEYFILIRNLNANTCFGQYK